MCLVLLFASLKQRQRLSGLKETTMMIPELRPYMYTYGVALDV